MKPWLLVGTIIVIGVLCFCIFSTFILVAGVPDDKSVQEAAKFYLENNQKTSDIVLTYTTMPKRLVSPMFQTTLASFLLQSRKLQQIRINIPYHAKRTGQEYIIPEWLTKLHNDKIVHIERCEDDGPATKYLPTLRFFQNQPTQRILVYDDDSVMPSNLVDTFHDLPKDICWTTCGMYIRKDNLLVTGQPSIALRWLLTFSKTIAFPPSVPTQVHIAMGWSGYLLSPNMVNLDQLTDYDSMPKDSFFVDDITMSGCLHRSKTPIFVAPKLQHASLTRSYITSCITNFLFANDDSLSVTENASKQHDHVMVDFFEKDWLPIDSASTTNQ